MLWYVLGIVIIGLAVAIVANYIGEFSDRKKTRKNSAEIPFESHLNNNILYALERIENRIELIDSRIEKLEMDSPARSENSMQDSIQKVTREKHEQFEEIESTAILLKEIEKSYRKDD